MTIRTIYQLKQAAYAQHAERWRTIRRHAYPETNGRSQYIHNWIACDRSAPDADLAGIIATDGEWASWHRIEARIMRWYDAAEHRDHAKRGMHCHWCAHCQRAA